MALVPFDLKGSILPPVSSNKKREQLPSDCHLFRFLFDSIHAFFFCIHRSLFGLFRETLRVKNIFFDVIFVERCVKRYFLFLGAERCVPKAV